MKIPPLKFIILGLFSGLCSSAISWNIFAGGRFSAALPGLAYGTLFLIWLPGMKKQPVTKRVGLVIESTLICFIAIRACGQSFSSAPDWEWLAYGLAGAFGAVLLYAVLSLVNAVKRSLRSLGQLALLGFVLGLVFNIPVKTSDSVLTALCYGGFFATWQLGVGILLYNLAADKNG